MKALIVANGEAPDLALVRDLAAEADLVVAADGGSSTAFASGITPDFIVGDLDSVDDVDPEFPDDRIIRLSDQSATDLEKAVGFCLQRGCDEVDIVGAGGGRADHALSNLSILVLYRDKLKVRLVDDWFETSLVNGTTEVSGEPGTVVSLVALGVCTGVTTEGLRWKLQNDTLDFSPHGIHNELIGETGSVTVREGNLFLFQGRWVERHS